MSTDDPITLSPETSRRLRSKIVANGYADAEDLIQDALNYLEPADSENQELEPWMIAEAVAACEEYDRDPSTGRTSEQVQATLDAAYERALKAG